MNEITSYPSIRNLGHRGILDLFEGPIIIQEKIDGSQISFCKSNGLYMRSKGKAQSIISPDALFIQAAETLINIKDKLKEGWVYRGEYLQKPHHNTINYNRTPDKHIILFDIMVGDQNYLPYEEVAEEAASLGLEIVPLFYSGDGINITQDQIESFLEQQSILGGSKIEGVVIKNYNLFGVDGKPLMGKFVSPEFKETNIDNNRIKRHGDIIHDIVEVFRSENRFKKAVQHLRDNGEITGQPQDIGKLIKHIHADVLDECSDEIKDMLFKEYKKRILQGVLKGFPEWYLQQIEGQQDGQK